MFNSNFIERITNNKNKNNNNNNEDNDNFNNNNCEYEFPFEINSVDTKIASELLKDFEGERHGYVTVGPKNYIFPSTFKKHYKYLYNYQSRCDDIWVATFPRSGTTWTQELVWMVANDLDYEGAQTELLTKRSPFFEFCLFMNDDNKEMFLREQCDNPKNMDFIRKAAVPSYEFMPNVTGQRFLKTHLPFSLLPPSIKEQQSKVIYVARNPKDVVVSFYHLLRLYRTTGYVGDFPRFWEYFERDLMVWAPYWEHIKEGWEHRNDPNVLFMFYEDMNKDLPATIRKVAKFLNKTLTEEEVEKLTDYLRIENFRNNQAVNQHELREVNILKSNEQSFVRNGKSTLKGWQKEYTPEIAARVEQWMNKNLEQTDFRFPDF